MKRISIVIGTRPEAIKMAPVVHALLSESSRSGFHVDVIASGQHREIFDDVADELKIPIAHNLRIGSPGKSLGAMTSSILTELEKLFTEARPDLVLVHGDTVTSFATALACFYLGIKVFHVEAGLRSGDLSSPFPEELSRRAIALLASKHFAVDTEAADHLKSEGTDPKSIVIAGNTVLEHLKKWKQHTPRHPNLIITLHRREKGVGQIESILNGVRSFHERNPGVEIVFPLHPNPAIRTIATRVLGDHRSVRLLPPLSHTDFLRRLARCTAVLTDSGGVQEEATHFGKPVLVARDITERRAGVREGHVRIVGTSAQSVSRALHRAFVKAHVLKQGKKGPAGAEKTSAIVSTSQIITDHVRRMLDDSDTST